MATRLTELSRGTAFVRLVGQATINDKSFSEPKINDKKTWTSIRNSFGIDTGNKNIIYVQVAGGYKPTNPIVYAMNNDFEPLQIPFADRFDEEILKSVNRNNFISVGIEKDEEGKLIIKRFLHPIDASAYIAEHLQNGEDVIATGDVEYSQGKEGRIYRNFNLKTLFLNEDRKRNEEVIPKMKPEATLRQTYLLGENSLSKKFSKELEKERETTLNVFVPQFLSQVKAGDSYVEYKKVAPLPQQVIVRIPDGMNEDKLEKFVSYVKKQFSVKKGRVTEMGMICRLNEGFKEETGAVEITKEMRELIELGIMTEEEAKEDATIRTNIVSETIFHKPAFKIKNEGDTQKTQDVDTEKYDPTVLIFKDAQDVDLESDEGEIDLDSEFGMGDTSNDKPESKDEDDDVAQVGDDFDVNDVFGSSIFG